MRLNRGILFRQSSGMTMLATLIALVILSTVAATVFSRSIPAYRSTYHTSAWLEAKLAADAGVDYAVASIQKSLPHTTGYNWPGWTFSDGTPVTVNSDDVRITTPPADLLAQLGDGSVRPAVTRLEVDVLTRDSNVSLNPWYRIRSTGTAEIPKSQLGLDKRDLFLRRMSLQKGQVSRTIEVLTRPVYLWEYALKTSGQMVLGGGTTWRIDSYDSRDETKSTNHIYDAAKARDFGNIASNLRRPADSPYGMLIDAEGAAVRGEVQTHGGDDPATDTFENVEESTNIDQSRITSEFDETLIPTPIPTWVNSPDIFSESLTVIPSSHTRDGGAAGSSPTNPVRISLDPRGNQNHGGFTVAARADGRPGFVEIYVNADLDLGGSTIVVAPNVQVVLYVNGNIDLKNQDVNYAATSSRYPGQLQIHGVKNDPLSPSRIDSSGNGHIVAVFYGPQYEGNLDGNTEIMGAFVLKTYNIAGGGGDGGDSLGAGMHYDEALGVTGPIQSYRVVSYFEDFRRDVE